MYIKRIMVTLLFLCFALSIFAPVTGATCDAKADSIPIRSEDYRAWSQYDGRWSNLHLGSSGCTVGYYGCTVTAVTKLIIQAGFKSSDTFNVQTLVNWLNGHNGFTANGSLYWGKPSEFVSGFSNYGDIGLSGSSLSCEGQIKNYVYSGHHVLIQVNNGAHWVAVDEAKTKSTGRVYIMDSLGGGAQNCDLLLTDRYSTITSLHTYTGQGNLTPTPTELSISGAVFPTGNLDLGKPFDLYGIISSPNNLKSVTVGIYTADNEETAEVKTYNLGNTTSFNIRTQADADIKFNAITKAGYYRYKVTATNQTETKELINSQFTMGNPTRPEKPVLHTSVNGSSVTVSWQSCSGATAYDVSFFEKGNNSNMVHVHYGITSTSYTTTLASGDYMVHVAAVNKNMASCWMFSDWAYLTVSYSDYEPGDVNNDGKLNSGDAVLILRNCVGLNDFNEKQAKAADIDGDGRITTGDAVRILRISVGLYT